MMVRAVSHALLSVSDKSGIVEFARTLHANGVTLLSTGGTARTIANANLPVIEISDYTGFAEIMDGRVKTLHPKIHGGILARRGIDEAVMIEHDIQPIDMVVINLYPFQSTVANPDCHLEDAIENIDIGGPAMIRAAAKNHAQVTVVVDPHDYASVLTEMESHHGEISQQMRFSLATKAYAHTAHYDSAIAHYFARIAQAETGEQFPDTLSLQFERVQALRYGENPHQQAAFYRETGVHDARGSTIKQQQGRALSYNNIADMDTAFEIVRQFERPACVIVKHANPCGVAMDKTIHDAYQRAFCADSESAFGGIIAFNRILDADTAQAIIKQQFVEVIIAPEVDEVAGGLIADKQHIRLLCCDDSQSTACRLDYKCVNGGLLVQDVDAALYQQLDVVTDLKPDQAQMEDLLFAWRVAKFVKSNAIVYVRNSMTIGIGAGQMSRINSVRIAATKADQANLQVAGSVMASDAFLPFCDSIDAAQGMGIRAIIQPGGAKRDDAVIAAADKYGIAMVFTGMRHFRH